MTRIDQAPLVIEDCCILHNFILEVEDNSEDDLLNTEFSSLCTDEVQGHDKASGIAK